jgi:ech hydrogenase subunit F
MRLFPEALRNLFRPAFTRRYPKQKPVIPQGFRGKLAHDPVKCIYCGMCAKYCPSNCITVDQKRKTWTHDLGQCLFCGQCAETCHEIPKKDAIKLTQEYELSGKGKKNLKWTSKQKK